MDELSLNEIKKIELDILVFFDQFCKKNKLNYSLAGGTLLGAIRHKGFIPWDDDIDVIMPREDYQKLLDIFNNDNAQYRLISYENTKKYNYLFSKIVDSRTNVVEQHNFSINELGVYIDVFPIDFLGDSLQKAKKQLSKIRFDKYLGVASNWKHFYINNNRSILRQIPRFLFYIFSRRAKVKKRYTKIEEKFKKNNYLDFSGCICGSYEEREIMSTNVFNEYIVGEFESYEFSILKNYDEYLRNIYGDYMKLPPIDKQITHHTFDAYMKGE